MIEHRITKNGWILAEGNSNWIKVDSIIHLEIANTVDPNVSAVMASLSDKINCISRNQTSASVQLFSGTLTDCNKFVNSIVGR